VKLWPFLAVPVLSIAAYFWLDDASTPLPGSADWPDGFTSEGDFWHGGVFLGYKADRIRRIWTWRKIERLLGNSSHDKRHIYFASIAVPVTELQDRLAAWRNDPSFQQQDDKVLQTVPPEWPSWFPHPSRDTYVGTLVDAGATISIYKKPDDNNLYLWFDG
jgi:hypothetical protein